MNLVTNANQKQALFFLDEMKTDLNVATELYDKKIYSRSFHSLQQAVEEGIKAQILFFDIIESEQLQQVGHTGTEGYKVAVEIMDRQKEDLKIFYKDEPITQEFINCKLDLSKLKGYRENSVNILTEIKEKEKRFKNIKESDLKSYLQILANKYNQIEEFRKKIEQNEFSEKDFSGIKDKIKEILRSKKNTPSPLEKQEDDLIDLFMVLLIRYISFKSIIICLLDLIGSIIFLTALTIISQSHHESTQYPTRKANTETIYSPISNPLVRHLKEFIKNGEISRKYLIGLFDCAAIVEEMSSKSLS